MKTRLNLATTPLQNNRRFLLGALSAGTTGLAALAFLSLNTYSGWRENRRLVHL